MAWTNNLFSEVTVRVIARIGESSPAAGGAVETGAMLL
jgi:hypothetical protein